MIVLAIIYEYFFPLTNRRQRLHLDSPGLITTILCSKLYIGSTLGIIAISGWSRELLFSIDYSRGIAFEPSLFDLDLKDIISGHFQNISVMSKRGGRTRVPWLHIPHIVTNVLARVKVLECKETQTGLDFAGVEGRGPNLDAKLRPNATRAENVNEGRVGTVSSATETWTELWRLDGPSSHGSPVGRVPHEDPRVDRL